jgi:hypothetical protein
MWMVGVIALGTMMMSCAAPQKGGQGAECATNDDCDIAQNLECRAKRCRTIAPKNPPIVRASIAPDITEVGQKVLLDARESQSRDPMNTILSFTWSIKSRPELSKNQIQDANKAYAHFIPDVSGEYLIQILVQSGEGEQTLSSTLELRLTAIAMPNRKPIANAGPDLIVELGSNVQLDGSESVDPDGDQLTYLWDLKTRPANSQAQLSNATEVNPSFVADQVGLYVLHLKVTDTRGEQSEPDSISIRALEGADKIPQLTKMTPAEGGNHELSLMITLEGRDFVRAARLSIGNRDFSTKFISNTKLEASVNLALIGPGVHPTQVTNTNGKASTPPLNFTIKDTPPPTLLKLSPDAHYTGTKLIVKVNGNHFIAGYSEVLFQDVPLITRITSDTALEFDLDLTKTPIGTYSVEVRNPGNRLSNKLTFRVLDKPAAPVLNTLNPPLGVTDTKISFGLHGIGFEQGAEILFDGQIIPSRRIRRDEIVADPHLDLTGIKPGLYEVWVLNPDGQASNKDYFSVREKDPAPQLSRILPFQFYLGEKFTDVAIHGQDLMQDVRIKIGTNEISGNFGKIKWKSESFVLAEIDLSDKSKWSEGELDAVAINPNGKISNAFKVLIGYRVPVISAIVPGSWTSQCDTEVEIRGQNFIPAIKILFGNVTFSTTSTTHPLTYIDQNLVKLALKTTTLSANKYTVIAENAPNARSPAFEFLITTGESPTPYVLYIRPAFGRANTTVPVEIEPEYSTGKYDSVRIGAVVMLDGKKQVTNCQTYSFSSSYCYDLTAELDLTGLKPGIYDLFVANPCNVLSTANAFVVEDPPIPYISQISPPYARKGDKHKISFKGEFFHAQLVLVWNGKEIPMKFISNKEFETVDPIDFANIEPQDIAFSLKDKNNQYPYMYKYSVIDAFVPIIEQLENNVQSAGQILNTVKIIGSGFVLTSTVHVGDKAVNANFISTKELQIPNFDATQLKEGAYNVQVINRNRKSNIYPLCLSGHGGTSINYLNPSSAIAGSASNLSLAIYGQSFSTTPRSTIIIKDPEDKDVADKFSITSFTSTIIRGTFDISALKPGYYIFKLKNPNGSESNRIVFNISPPPPPTISSINPLYAFRSNPQQIVQINGNNFISGDLIIFNNNLLNQIPGILRSAGTLEATLDLSRIKFAGSYDIYVMRCLDALCQKTERTKALPFSVRNPPCSAINCKTEIQPPNSENCDTSDNVCRPICSSNDDCKKLDANAPWSCQNGFCKK